MKTKLLLMALAIVVGVTSCPGLDSLFAKTGYSVMSASERKTANAVWKTPAKRDVFKEIKKNEVWVKENGEYKVITISVTWPESLSKGDEKILQNQILLQAFGLKDVSIENAIQSYIRRQGKTVKKPKRVDGMATPKFDLEIKKEAYKEGKFIVFSISELEHCLIDTHSSGPEMKYIIFDLNNNSLLSRNDIVKNFRSSDSQLLQIIKGCMTRDDLDFYEPTPEGLSDCKIFLKENSVVFAFSAIWGHEARVEVLPQKLNNYLTDQVKEFYGIRNNIDQFNGNRSNIDPNNNKIYDICTVKPSFSMGNVETLISNNMQYPAEAARNGVQGRVTVGFVVEKDGSLSNIRVMRGVDPSLDKEAVRLVKAMPKWNPGKENGEIVRVNHTLPVNFKL